jgi:regulator of replication initiation timing
MNNFENNLLQLIRQETANLSAENEKLVNENQELKKRLDLVTHVAQHGITSTVESPEKQTKTHKAPELSPKTCIHLLENKIKTYFKDECKFDDFVDFVKDDNLVQANACLVQAFKSHVNSVNANAQCLLYAHAYRATYNSKSRHMSGSFKSLARYINQKRLSYNEVKQYVPAFRM